MFRTLLKSLGFGEADPPPPSSSSSSAQTRSSHASSSSSSSSFKVTDLLLKEKRIEEDYRMLTDATILEGTIA